MITTLTLLVNNTAIKMHKILDMHSAKFEPCLRLRSLQLVQPASPWPCGHYLFMMDNIDSTYLLTILNTNSLSYPSPPHRDPIYSLPKELLVCSMPKSTTPNPTNVIQNPLRSQN